MPSFEIQSEYRRAKRGAKYGNGKLGGYPGLAFTCHQIAEYFPPCKIYVEPFAGLGRTAKYAKADKVVLNDMSEFAFNTLKSKFRSAHVTQKDFLDCILENDTADTFFLIDPPWRRELYDGNDAFIDRHPFEYYTKLLEVLPQIKANWFVCGDSKERGIKKILTESGYPQIIIKSRRTILGKPAQVKIISNKPFVRYHQATLTL